MKLDEFMYVQLEQCGFPGNIGDSCAETGRLVTLFEVIGDRHTIDLSKFVTDVGVLRHPNSPWREIDTSGDQVSPLLAASSLTQPEVASKVIAQLNRSGYRTGNGDLISPGTYAMMRRAEGRRFLWLSDLAVLGQALLMKAPIRWSDSKRWFESNENSSADYLNFVNALAFAHLKGGLTWPCVLAMKIIPWFKVVSKVQSYYSPEPNCDFLLNLYDKAIIHLWSRR